MKENRQLLVILHLSQLLYLITVFGGLIVALIIWQTQKEEVFEMDHHGKMILNFQLSMLLYSILSVPLILFFGLGIIVLVVIGLLTLIFPIINAINTNHGNPTRYPLAIQFIK